MKPDEHILRLAERDAELREVEKANRAREGEMGEKPNLTTRAIDWLQPKRDYPEHVRTLVALLEEAREEGRQEGFATAREMALEIVSETWSEYEAHDKIRALQPPRDEGKQDV